jgi:hypothetical protein
VLSIAAISHFLGIIYIKAGSNSWNGMETILRDSVLEYTLGSSSGWDERAVTYKRYYRVLTPVGPGDWQV